MRSTERPGQALVEVIVAMAVLVTFVSAFARLAVGSYDGGRRGSERTIAAGYAQQGLEAARSIARRDFGLLIDGPHGLSETSSRYGFLGTADSLTPFARVITVAPVQRNADDVIVPSGGTADPLTKEVTSTVTWATQGGVQNSVTLTSIFTSWSIMRWVIDTLAELTPGLRNSSALGAASTGEVQQNTLNDLTNPSAYLSFNPTGTANVADAHIDIAADRLYLATGDDAGAAEFLAYDISDVSANTPTLAGSTELGASGSGFALGLDYAYILSGDASKELRIVRLKDMIIVNEWNVPGLAQPSDIVFDQSTNRLYIATGFSATTSEFLIIDVSNPLSLTTIGGVDFAYGIRHIALRSGYAYLAAASTSGEVQIVNVSNLAAVSCDITGSQLPNDIAISGTGVYLARDSGASSEFIGMKINPAAPTDCTYINANVMGQTDLPVDALSLAPAISHNVMFSLMRDAGAELRAINLQTYASTTVDLTGSFCDAATFLGDYLYVGCRDDVATVQVLQGGASGQELICTDGLQNGWTISNVSNTTNTANTFLVRTGANSLLLNPAANGSTQFNKTYSTANTTYLDGFVNTVSPWAFGVYGGNAGTPGTLVSLTNNTYGGVYQKNTEEGAFTDFPVADFAAMKALAQSTSSYITTGANYTLTTANLSTYAGKIIFVEFTNAARVLTVNLGSSAGPFNVSIVMTGGNRIDFTNYNNTVMNSASSLYPAIATPLPINFTVSNRNMTVNGLIFTSQKVSNAMTSTRRLTVNGSIIAATVDTALKNLTLTYASDFNTTPPTHFTPNYFGQNLQIQANTGTPVQLTTYATLDKDPTTWQRVLIPIGDLGIANTTISYLKFSDTTATNKPSIFLDDLRWIVTSGGGALPVWASYTSPAFDSASALTAWAKLRARTSGTGSVVLQLRTASTQPGLTSALWVGPTGTRASSYTANSWQSVTTDPAATGTQWIQWKAQLTGSGSTSPILEDVTLFYR